MLIDLIFFIAYACVEGVMNARVFAYGTAHFIASNQTDKTDIHIFFSLVRGVFFITILFVAFLLLDDDGPTLGNWVSVGMRGASFLLIFPFFHEGCYNITRRILEPDLTQYTWTYTTSQSTSKFNFVFWQRLLGLIAGTSLYYFTI